MRRLVLLFALAACRTETPAPVDRDGRGTALGETCAALRDAGCPEGDGRPNETCFEHLTKVSEIAIVPSDCFPPAERIRTCGDAGTLRFRCRR